jgi:hypothetical protein
MTSIYRFETLEFFEQMVHDEELTFVTPYFWPDKNEGLLFKHAFFDSDMEKVKVAANQMFGSTFTDKDIGETIADLLIVLRTTRLAQCWSKCEGNCTLWDNKDVRIEVHREDLSHLPSVEVHDVEYVESVTIEDGLKRLNIEQVAGKGLHIDIDNVLLVKHNSFLTEHEVRLLVIEGENVNRDRPERIPFTQVFTQLHRQGKMSTEDYEKNISHLRLVDKKRISFARIDNFIKSVMLHPFASTEAETKVQNLCKEYSLNYLGRWQPKTS